MNARPRNILLILCAATLTNVTCAQWPRADAGGTIRRIPEVVTGGCARSSADVARMDLKSLSYKSPPFTRGDPDEALSEGLMNSAATIGVSFEVDPEYGVYNDSVPNALALPVDISNGKPRPSEGTVLIGRHLILEEQRRSSEYWGTSVTMFMAHEFAHIHQYKKNLNLPVRQRELHADFMAGWYLGETNRRTGGSFANMEFAARSLFAKGDYEYNAANAHGSPEQRVGALLAGYKVGLARRPLEDAFQRGIAYVQE